MYYLISFMYQARVFYCIWVTGAEDFVLSNNSHIVYFQTLDEVIEYERIHNLVIKKDEDPHYNLDKVIQWCEDNSKFQFECDELLNVWNIFADVAHGVQKDFLGNDRKYDELYEKIFDANGLMISDFNLCNTNLYFSSEEVADINKVLKNGLELFVESIN